MPNTNQTNSQLLTEKPGSDYYTHHIEDHTLHTMIMMMMMSSSCDLWANRRNWWSSVITLCVCCCRYPSKFALHSFIIYALIVPHHPHTTTPNLLVHYSRCLKKNKKWVSTSLSIGFPITFYTWLYVYICLKQITGWLFTKTPNSYCEIIYLVRLDLVASRETKHSRSAGWSALHKIHITHVFVDSMLDDDDDDYEKISMIVDMCAVDMSMVSLGESNV